MPADFFLYSAMSFLVVVVIFLARLPLLVRLPKAGAIAVESLLWLALITNSVLVWHQGLHLDSPSAIGAFAMNDFNFGVSIPLPMALLATMCVIAIPVGESFLFRFCRSRSWPKLDLLLKPSRLVVYFALLAIGLFVLETQADFATVPNSSVPIYQSIVRLALGFPSVHIRSNADVNNSIRMINKPDVLMILSESFRWDLIDEKLTPNLYALAHSPACVYPDKSYAGGHLTSVGSFAYLYGLESYLARPYFKSRRFSPALSIFRQNGYQIFGSDASGLPSYNPDILQLQQFDFYDKHNEHHKAENDIDAVESLQHRMSDTPTDTPVFGFLFFYSTHFPYFAPEKWPQLATPIIDKGGYTQSFRDFQRSATFVDAQAAEIIRAFRARPHNRGLIIAFAGDHGEEFGEHGGQGHGAIGFADVRTRVPNIVCFPEGQKVPPKKVAFASNADVLPSIFDWSGVEPADLDRIFTGRSYWSSKPRQFAILSGAYFPTDGRDFAVTNGQNKVRLYYSGAGPRDSQLVWAADANDKRIEKPVRAELQPMIEAADREFHRDLIVDGSVSANASTTENTPSQH